VNGKHARYLIAGALVLIVLAGARSLINSDWFGHSLVWWDGDTFRYWAATQAVFARNRAERLGIEWDRADWHSADADQDEAARSVPRWVQRHIDGHVARQLGWDEQAGWQR
jgi:hypothetical protein